MSPAQRNLARHALGLPNERNCSYRNRYVVSTGVPAYVDWCELVKIGAASRAPGEGLRKGREMFALTYEGQSLL